MTPRDWCVHWLLVSLNFTGAFWPDGGPWMDRLQWFSLGVWLTFLYHRVWWKR